MTCQPGNLSTNHLNATISGNDFSYPVMLLEDHGRYMRRFADCVFPSLFGLCRLAIYPAIAFTAQPQRTGKRMRFTVNIGAHFCRRELFFIWLMLPLSGGVIEKCAAADKDTKKSWAAIVKPLPASLYPGRTCVRPHASPVPESSMLQWPPVLTTSKTHAEVPSRQQESSEATVRTHPKRRPDRKRQYYRNPSAERFDQQIEALANEVNRLKKQLHGPHRESHKTALLDLAFQITERDPHPLRASPRALALLANAFSKLAKYQEGATALDWIMKAVIHRSQKQQLTKQCGFKAQTLAMVLNSLSQVAGNDADTTRKALAKEVGRRALAGDLKCWIAQDLAMVTSGLRQVTGDDAVTTRKALAKEVGRRALAGDLKCWIAQDLAMVTNGLRQVEGDDADTTRKALAKEVGRRALAGDLECWIAQHLAMVTNGLSPVAGDDADTTRKALAKEVGRRALAGDLKCWIAQHLAMVTNGLSRVAGDDADTTRKALAKEVGSRDLTGTKEWSAQHLAMVTNGLSQVTGDDANTTRKALAKEVGRRALAGDLKCWIAQDLAMVTNRLSPVAGDDADMTRKALAKEVGRRALAGDLKCWIAQHLAMVTNGLSQVAGDDADTTRKALAKEVGSRDLTDTKDWSAQPLAMVTNGLRQVTGDDADTTRKALAKEVGRRALAGDLKCWIAQDLAMVTNGLSQVAGDDADTTRKTLAKEVGSRDLTNTKEWSAQPLAMVTNGLSQVTGDDADTTRKTLAKEVGSRDLTDTKEWSAQHLAMVTNGLSQVTGDDADTTRKALAKEVGIRDLTNTKEWSAQHLTMVTNGLSPVAGDDADTTRKALAKEVGRRALAGDLKCWIVQDLAMVTNGLRQVAGDDADTTRKALAKEVGSRDLTDTSEWSAQSLAMVASGMSHCSHVIGEDVVQASIQAIMNISPTEQDIIMALDALCRLSLSDDHLKLGYFLVKRLCDMTGFIDTGGPLKHSVGDFLWNLAVLDLCAKQNPPVKDDPDTPRFDIFVKPLMDRENIRDLLSHHWQDRFAYIYWAGISNLEIDVSPALSAPEKKVKVSALQNRVFQAVKHALPNQNIVMEVNIEGFPVDILVGKTLCIEVDGPHHYIQDETMENDELLLAKESGKRRARDPLIDHILKSLGFEVLRISYVETDSVAGLGTFVDRVINAMDEQEMSSQYEGLRVNDLPAW